MLTLTYQRNPSSNKSHLEHLILTNLPLKISTKRFIIDCSKSTPKTSKVPAQNLSQCRVKLQTKSTQCTLRYQVHTIHQQQAINHQTRTGSWTPRGRRLPVSIMVPTAAIIQINPAFPGPPSTLPVGCSLSLSFGGW